MGKYFQTSKDQNEMTPKTTSYISHNKAGSLHKDEEDSGNKNQSENRRRKQMVTQKSNA